MRKRFILAILVLLLAALACTNDVIVVTVTGEPMDTLAPEPTASATAIPVTSVPTLDATPIETPAATATIGPIPTPTQIVGPGSVFVPPDAADMFSNGGFEPPYPDAVHDGLTVYPHMVAFGWHPWFGAFGYLDYEDNFPAPYAGTKNPDGLVMGRPEYKPDIYRVFSGANSQQWFCYLRACLAGVFQVVNTTPGDVCVVDAWVQSWSATDDRGHLADGSYGERYTSDQYTQDQRDNSVWLIRVDTEGGLDAFRDGLLETRFEQDGHPIDTYDQWTHVTSDQFQVTGPRTTVFIGNLRLWPIAHNDNYLDVARMRCVGTNGDYTPSPPDPTMPPDPAEPERRFDPLVQDVSGTYASYNSQYTRLDHSTSAQAVGGLVAFEPATYYAIFNAPSGDRWLCLDEGRAWWAHEIDPTLWYLHCREWAALRIGNAVFGTILGE